MVDTVLRWTLPGADDDAAVLAGLARLAVLAVRMSPQDRPRPLEAGPEVVPPDVSTEG